MDSLRRRNRYRVTHFSCMVDGLGTILIRSRCHAVEIPARTSSSRGHSVKKRILLNDTNVLHLTCFFTRKFPEFVC